MKRLLAAAALCVAMQSPQAWAKDRTSYWRFVTEAVGDIVEGDHVNAVVLLAKARQAHDTPFIDALVGVAGLAGGRLAEGRNLLERAVRAKATDPLIYYWAARAAFAAHRIGLAQRRMRQARAVGGRSACILFGQALVALAAGKSTTAVRTLADAAKTHANLLDPRLFPTPSEGAVALLHAALHDFPEIVQLQKTQGHLYWRLGKTTAALERFDAVLARQPGHADALQMKARCANQLHQTHVAATVSAKALEVAPNDPQARATRGELLLAAKKPAEALPLLKQAADQRPRDAGLLRLVGRACVETKKDSCALKYYTYAHRLDPRDATIRVELALVLKRADKLSEALNLLKPVVLSNLPIPKAHEVAAHLFRIKGNARLAQKYSATARHMRRTHRRFEARQARINRLVKAIAAVTENCTTPTCPQLDNANLTPQFRKFFIAHLAAKAGKMAKARQLITAILPTLRPRRLFLSDPTTLIFRINKGKSTQRIQASLPIINPALLTPSKTPTVHLPKSPATPTE